MRLWHEKLIPLLPRQQLLGQHRECAALRGNGWGKKHATVDYVFEYAPIKLVWYHLLVMEEMIDRGYKVSEEWLSDAYRGMKCFSWTSEELVKGKFVFPNSGDECIYPEHNDAYLEECLANLRGKGIELKVS